MQSMNKIFAARNMFDVIIDMVVKDDNSPYNEMINKTKNIDIDYFEKIDTYAKLFEKNTSMIHNHKKCEQFFPKSHFFS